MDHLLELLQEGTDEEAINNLACEHFITDGGQCNWEAMRRFEKMANCSFECVERDSFGWLIGGIRFNGKLYTYG